MKRKRCWACGVKGRDALARWPRQAGRMFPPVGIGRAAEKLGAIAHVGAARGGACAARRARGGAVGLCTLRGSFEPPCLE